MSKILKIGFAMGGGVSLGTFSSAALTETIKQLIIYGKDSEGKAFSRVEIDVFSGASAGAMSLGIMLRGLSCFTDKASLVNPSIRTESDWRLYLHEQLEKQFNKDLERLRKESSQKYEDLLAAQALQEIQTKIWKNEISIEKLLGITPLLDMSKEPGVVSRKAVDDIAARYFKFDRELTDIRSTKRILADRVLFGCTLTNLSPIVYNAKSELTHTTLQNASLLKALDDGMTSAGHAELRVFDISFSPLGAIDQYPERWMQFQHADVATDKKQSISEKEILDIRTNAAWRKIAATSIASGAFPLAFAPVALERYRYEYHSSIWPEQLADKKSFPFSYIDGGTLNNEPIREAFKLAAFLDALDTKKAGTDYERRIIFVDPIIASIEPKFSFSIHKPFSTSSGFLNLNEYHTEARPTASKLLGHIPEVFATILDEAKLVESDRIYKTMDKFELRNQITANYHDLISESTPNKTIENLLDQCKSVLEKVRERLLIPAGGMSVSTEIKRIVRENKTLFAAISDIEPDYFLQNYTRENFENKKLWVTALLIVLTDLMMDMGDKMPYAELIPIGPFKFNGDQADLMKLPGGELAGFAGFASEIASEFEIMHGRYCAKEILERFGLIERTSQFIPHPETFDKQGIRKELEERLVPAIQKRTKELLENSVLPDFLYRSVKEFIGKHLDEMVDSLYKQEESTEFSFKIQLPDNEDELFELRGFKGEKASNHYDLEMIKTPKGKFLATDLKFYMAEEKKPEWRGVNTNASQLLYVDVHTRSRFKGDDYYLQILLPSAEQIQSAKWMANPVFIIELHKTDKGTLVSNDRWKIESGIEALDNTLF